MLPSYSSGRKMDLPLDAHQAVSILYYSILFKSGFLKHKTKCYLMLMTLKAFHRNKFIDKKLTESMIVTYWGKYD